MSEFPTLQDLVWAARQKLPSAVWEFVTFGTESETTLRRNRHSLDSLAFINRVMRDVSEVDTTTSLLGVKLRIPVVLAPVGSIALLDPGGALTAAKVAEEFEIMHVVSGFADPGYKAVAEGIKDKSRIVYALHPRAEQPFLDDLVDGVKAAGYKAITFVSEGAYYSRRERDLMSGLATKSKRSRTYSSYLQQMRDERAAGKTATKEGLLGTMITWEMLERVKSRSGLPLILKGITNAQDARLAMEHGVDVIYVSNHGGRSLDHARGTIQSLPDVVDAVKGKVDIIVDGGFVRGSDVLKAISLGAKAVSMGRMQSWALAAAGAAGLTRMLEILEEEIIVAMGLLGVTKLDQLGRDYVTPSHPVTQPHPLSAFPVVMERIAKE